MNEKGDEAAIMRILHPIEDMLSDVPRIVVKDGAAAALSHGAPLYDRASSTFLRI